MDSDFQLLLTKESYKQNYFNSSALFTVSLFGSTAQTLRKNGVPTDFQFSLTADHLFDILLKAKLETKVNQPFYQRVFLEPEPYLMTARFLLNGDITIEEEISGINYVAGEDRFMLAHASGRHFFKRWELSEMSYSFPQIALRPKTQPLPWLNLGLGVKLSHIEKISQTSGKKQKSRNAVALLDGFSFELVGMMNQRLLAADPRLETVFQRFKNDGLVTQTDNNYQFDISLNKSILRTRDGTEKKLILVLMGVMSELELNWL